MAKLALIETRPHPSGRFIPYQATLGLCKSVYFSASRSLSALATPVPAFRLWKKKKPVYFILVLEFLLSLAITTTIVSRGEKKKKEKEEKKGGRLRTLFSPVWLNSSRQIDRSHIFFCANASLVRRLNRPSREFNDFLSWFQWSVSALHWSIIPHNFRMATICRAFSTVRWAENCKIVTRATKLW